MFTSKACKNLKFKKSRIFSRKFGISYSTLTFVFSTQENKNPFYHFAFNIPENKIQQAKEWQLKRIALIEPPDHLKDLSRYTKNIVHFRHWNAHSVFFYDPAGNVVEYIARHPLPNQSKGAFTANDILYISEIGLVVDQMDQIQKDLLNHYGIKKYGTSSNQFMALRDELGLILLMGKHTKAVFQKGRKREIYETEVVLNNKNAKPGLSFENYPYRVLTK